MFLDRDGTVARDVPYCSRVEDFELLPMVPEAVRLLNESGFSVILVTNQSGIARGYFDEQTLSSIHEKMNRDLAESGARLDAVYVCPHHPDDDCPCRKPRPGLIFQAAEEMGIELSRSFVIGDHARDILAGKVAGCRTVLVTTGPDGGDMGNDSVVADFVADTLYEAAEFVCREAAPESDAIRQVKRSGRPVS